MLVQGPVSVKMHSSQHPEQVTVLRACKLEMQSMVLHHAKVLEWRIYCTPYVWFQLIGHKPLMVFHVQHALVGWCV